MRIDDILFEIDGGEIALPDFQRGYVWNREQVRGLMKSLYRKYPVGSLLVWVTRAGTTSTRGRVNGERLTSTRLLLDGQQRMTSLYGIIRGKAPVFFEGDAKVFQGLYFHLDDEAFEFYSAAKMSGDPLWVNVTELVQTGVGGPVLERVMSRPELASRAAEYINRLNAVVQIRDIDLHVEEVMGDDKTVDVVVDIFNRVNSGGTKLSKGDLALAKICADWPEARQRLREALARWRALGFDFTMEWLLRVVTTIETGRALLEGLEEVGPKQFETGLARAEKAINFLLGLVSGRLGIDHDRVLGGRYAFVVMARYVALSPTGASDPVEQAKLLYWYVHSFIWGRFAGSTETTVNQDLAAIEKGGLSQLLDVLRRSRGDLTIRPSDFSGTTVGARFYPLVYILARTHRSRDLAAGGRALQESFPGGRNHLEVHEMFPKALLYEKGFQRGEANAIANYCFLTHDAHVEIGEREPLDYFAEAQERFPGALESQWVPLDPGLWPLERYREFLAARRELLATAATSFLDNLLNSTPAAQPPITSPAAQLPTEPAGAAAEASVLHADEPVAREVARLVDGYGLVRPTTLQVVVHPVTGEELGVADAVWSRGVHGAYGEPVVLTTKPEPGDVGAMEAAGYRVFSSVVAFETFLESRSAGGPEGFAGA
jgi:hypothetical protein